MFGAAVGMLTAVTGCGGGLRLTPIRSASNRPSNVVVYFKVQNGHEPVGGLTADEVVATKGSGRLLNELTRGIDGADADR